MQSENSLRLESAVITSLTVAGTPSEDDILALARQLRTIPLYQVNDSEFDVVIRRLHASLRITMDVGTMVAEEHAPWLSSRKAEIEPYYWRRYSLYLRQQGWAPRVVTTLDEVTDEILDRLGNPASISGWPRKGLAMGDVQSGKTSNYTGLICKAADAGYRLIILLTGTLESLRRQTQGRLDAGFVGLDSSGVVTLDRRRREVGVGRLEGSRMAGVFTSTQKDFSTDIMTQLGFRLTDFREPVLLVVKKHKRILQNLTQWLQAFNADDRGQIDAPLLLIDDEADNASVNVRSADNPTAINEAIRGLLHIFVRSSYVGFTATPFANVFINPDSESEMVGSDLFPRDFVYALNSPSNYVGGSIIFGEDSPVDCLRTIEDASSAFPLKHRSDLRVACIPDSLFNAVKCFILANTLIDLRGSGALHRSMLVNVSHFTQVQEQVREQLSHELRQLQEDIRNYSRLPEHEALKSSSLAELKRAFDQEYSNAGFAWSEVQPALVRSVLPIEVRAVNQRTGAASLDYSQYKDTGLRVIAVGGNSLSRGLTLEGLCVSYFHRGTQMYDTLLQMGRWFGYRDGYVDLCRIWMPDEAISWYSHIVEAVDELRGEILHMQAARLKPIDFGLKVRAHPDSLLITARNKMRDSEQVERVISVSGEGLETYRLLSDAAVVRANALAIRRLVEGIEAAGFQATKSGLGNPLWTSVPKGFVVAFLRSFVSHPYNITFQPKELADFMERTDATVLDNWDIVIPNGVATRRDGEPATHRIGSCIVRLQRRRLLIDETERSLLVSERKMRVGSRGVEREGMANEAIAQAEAEFAADVRNAGRSISDRYYRERRKRPLLLLHLLHGIHVKRGTDGEVKSEVEFDVQDGPLAAVGLSFPKFDDSVGQRRVRYRVNLVEWRSLFVEEPGDDEGDGDAEP